MYIGGHWSILCIRICPLWMDGPEGKLTNPKGGKPGTRACPAPPLGVAFYLSCLFWFLILCLFPLRIDVPHWASMNQWIGDFAGVRANLRNGETLKFQFLNHICLSGALYWDVIKREKFNKLQWTLLNLNRIFQGSSWIFQESGMDFGMICARQRAEKFIKLY